MLNVPRVSRNTRASHPSHPSHPSLSLEELVLRLQFEKNMRKLFER